MRFWAQLGNSAYASLGGLALILACPFDYYWIMNSGRRPIFVLDQNCQVITNRIILEVEKAGMRTLLSFDLDKLRSSSTGFCCPIHGNGVCTCHLVILLILRQEYGSLTVILEGSDQQTSVYLDSGVGTTEEEIDPSLTAALIHAFFPEKFLNQTRAV